MEMRRFDEDFGPLTAETLQYCLRETHLDGTWPAQYARAIVHLELLRIDRSRSLQNREGEHSACSAEAVSWLVHALTIR
jgi:hypothetical protein